MTSTAVATEAAKEEASLTFHQLTAYFAELDATRSRIRMMKLLADLFIKTRPEEVDKVIYLLQGRVAPLYAPIGVWHGGATYRRGGGRRYRGNPRRRASTL